MESKTWKWVTIGLGAGTIFFLLLSFIPIIIFDKSFWWFFGTLLIFAVIWIIIGVIFLTVKLSKKKPVKLQIDLTKAEDRAIHEMKYDKENPDNFVIKQRWLRKIGERGAERTPVAILLGYGSEKLEKRVVIINMNNPEVEMSKLVEPTKEEIREAFTVIADNPPETEIIESISEGLDAFGRATPPRIKVTRPTQVQQKEQKEQEEAEEKVAM